MREVSLEVLHLLVLKWVPAAQRPPRSMFPTYVRVLISIVVLPWDQDDKT